MCRVFIIICFLLLAGCGGQTPDFQSMLTNLAGSYPNIWKLLTAASYVLGFSLCFKSIYTMKIYGEARAMAASHASMKTPLMYLLAGAALIFIPTTFSTINMTLFATPSILQYSGQGGIPGWTAESTKALVGLIQIIGLLAFIRGWIYIARAGEQGGQGGNVAKGFTHILGGVLAINIVMARDILWNTFGFGS